MPTHDPARKRRAFRRVPRKRKVFVEASPRAESEHTCARAMYDYGKDVVQPPVCEQTPSRSLSEYRGSNNCTHARSRARLPLLAVTASTNQTTR